MNDGLRVAVLSPFALPWHRPGGLERHVFELCRWLRREGVEVDLFTATPEHRADPFAGDPGFRLESVPGVPFLRRRYLVVASRSMLYPIFSLRLGRRVVALAADRRYTAVIAQGMAGFGYAVSGGEAPLILNPQGMEEALAPSPWKRAGYFPFRALLRVTARRASRIVATDRVLIPVVARVLRAPRERIVCLPNAVDGAACRELASEAVRREWLASRGLGKAEPLVVSVGRLAPNKGLAVGLEALARVAPELPPYWRWLIIGEGPLRAELEARARVLGVAYHVHFARSVDDVVLHSLLEGADLFLHPTLYEGSSLVTLEAMSHACQIVASRAGGIPDKIDDGVGGWLAEPGDPASLADALRRWWRSSFVERRRIGQTAERRASERFDWRSVVKDYVRLLEELR